MKKDIDPKIMGTVIAAVVLVAGVGLYFGLRGQGDRSGPPVQAKYEGGKSMGGGWKPGMSQQQMSGQGGPSVPGAASGTKPP